MNNYELLKKHVFVTKLAGFEHTKYIQDNETKQKANESDIPLVQGKNIKNGRFVENFEWYISKNISDLLVRSKLNKKCILIPYVGSNLGEVGIFDNNYECHMASNIAKVELIDDYFDLDYLKYYFQSNIGQSYLFRSKQGSAQPNITMESIRNTLVIDYKKDRQKKIANTLKNIDDKIDNNNKIINESEKLAKKIYDYWFIQFEFPDKNGNPYKSSSGKMIYNEKLKKDIPENWELKKLKDIAEMYQPETISVNKLKTNGKYNVYGANGIIGKYNEYNHEQNEIAVCCRGAGCGQYLMTLPFSWITGNAMIIKPKKNYNYKEYIYYKLSDKDIFNYITGSAQPQITRTNIENMKILIPSKLILEKFNNIAINIRNKIIGCLQENDELNNLKNYLLPLLMNGQVSFKG